MTSKEFSYTCCHFLSCFSNYGGKAKYLFICILLVCAANNTKAQSSLFNDSAARISTNVSPADVLREIKLPAIHFSKNAGNYINFGLADDKYNYFVIKIYAKSKVTGLCLSIDNTSLDTISIYKIYGDGRGKRVYLGGYLVPYDVSRQYVWHTLPVEVDTVPSYYLVALKAEQKNINVQYEILSSEQLQQKYQAHERVIWFYYGVLSFILLIILVAFRLFRDKIFLIYLGYIISLSAWIIAHYGYLFPLVYPNLPVLNEIVKPLTSLAAGYFLVTLLVNVFKANLRQRLWLYQVLTALRHILAVLCACIFLLLVHNLPSFLKASLMALWQISLFSTVCLIVFTPFYFIRSGTVAKMFATAMSVISIMSVIHELGNYGLINNYFINEHGITLASILENFIVTFGLFYGLLRENNKKKKQLIALKSEQADTLEKLISVQDNERKRIANDLHDNIGPLLAAIKINFRRLIDNKDALQNGLVHKTESIIDDSISEIRNVAHNLMPKSLASNGLIKTLREYFDFVRRSLFLLPT